MNILLTEAIAGFIGGMAIGIDGRKNKLMLEKRLWEEHMKKCEDCRNSPLNQGLQRKVKYLPLALNYAPLALGIAAMQVVLTSGKEYQPAESFAPFLALGTGQVGIYVGNALWKKLNKKIIQEYQNAQRLREGKIDAREILSEDQRIIASSLINNLESIAETGKVIGLEDLAEPMFDILERMKVSEPYVSYVRDWIMDQQAEAITKGKIRRRVNEFYTNPASPELILFGKPSTASVRAFEKRGDQINTVEYAWKNASITSRGEEMDITADMPIIKTVATKRDDGDYRYISDQVIRNPAQPFILANLPRNTSPVIAAAMMSEAYLSQFQELNQREVNNPL